MQNTFLGIEIGGTKLQIIAADGAGAISRQQRWTVSRTEGAAGIRQQLEAALPEFLAATKPAGVGVGFGGPVDWKTGHICRSHQIEGWSDFPMGKWLHDLTGQPVFVDNDANVAALGEALLGAGADFDPVFYVTMGSGVGGGLVTRGQIYHGAPPGESELGHVRLDRSGTILESRCSGWAVDARVRRVIAEAPDSLLARTAASDPGGEARHLLSALEDNDEAAQRILKETSEDLAFGLSHVIHLFHPEIVVLGGGLANLGEPLRAGVEAALARFVMGAFAPGVRVALAALGEMSVPIGAVRLVQARLRR